MRGANGQFEMRIADCGLRISNHMLETRNPKSEIALVIKPSARHYIKTLGNRLTRALERRRVEKIEERLEDPAPSAGWDPQRVRRPSSRGPLALSGEEPKIKGGL